MKSIANILFNIALITYFTYYLIRGSELNEHFFMLIFMFIFYNLMNYLRYKKVDHGGPFVQGGT